MIKFIFIIFATFMFTAANLLSATAQTTDKKINTAELSKATKAKKDVDIESDTMEILDDKNKAIFTGNVDAVRSDVRLKADKLVADFVKTKDAKGEEQTEVTYLHATGHVIIITSKQHITGAWAKMDVKADKAVVGGNVVVKQDNSIVRGKKLFVNLKTNHSVMKGGRVKGSFKSKTK